MTNSIMCESLSHVFIETCHLLKKFSLLIQILMIKKMIFSKTASLDLAFWNMQFSAITMRMHVFTFQLRICAYLGAGLNIIDLDSYHIYKSTNTW